jgi:hypothetical protein
MTTYTLKPHPAQQRLTARLSGNVLKLTNNRGGGHPPKKTPLEESAKRAKRHCEDKCNSLLLHASTQPMLYEQGWRLRFLTLTVAPFPAFEKGDEKAKRHIVNSALKAMMRRIKTRNPDRDKVAYVCVPEHGAEGHRLHLHLIIYTQYLSAQEWHDTWELGGIKIELAGNDSNSNLQTLYSYLVKYMGKDLAEIDSGCFGVKRYMSSRNIKRRITYVSGLLDNTDGDKQDIINHIAKLCEIRYACTWTAPDGNITVDTIAVPPNNYSISKVSMLLAECITPRIIQAPA